MSITVNAENVQDAADKMGLRLKRGDIRIFWRRNQEDYGFNGRIPEPGCIVDATTVPGEEVHRSFKTSGEALRYIASILKKHDARVKEAKAARAKDLREQEARMKQSAAPCRCKTSF